ncbi:hypothetical protein BJV78DRAFT_1134966 [Lactifluus subvellereus]|nr:hypothetical protein BJV78DRAFT_1134966 [Lactifluus subvellereus]
MSLSLRLTLFTLAFALFTLTNAQFQFFNEMFGQPQQQQQHRQQSGGQQWAMHAESLSCSEYLCPDTLVCVTKPVDCPCPNVQDIKCVVPDAQEAGSGTRICVRGGTDCVQVEKLAKKFAK